ncbi:Adapter protein CIKS [Anabarilius grahami]|uniref:E3 ubiquitin ligase TRAF3IP2 n=1 Tax=Anabarilius grahami TaxID=495550 RepID=A0A3N0YBY1_ANAGA|nr:Adapter protein CIKS [Anabarilius grahami]
MIVLHAWPAHSSQLAVSCPVCTPETFPEPAACPKTFPDPTACPETLQEPVACPETFREPAAFPETFPEPTVSPRLFLRLLPARRLSQSPLPTRLTQYRQVDTHFCENGHASLNPRQNPSQCTHLSQEQRKVFVTYEADSEEHLKEIIKFVALLRNNGFDTHIDVFEQQLNSISKIDCMERYLNEKDYLIIIIISLRYYETISGINISMDRDERTSNTVYIHRQLQSEFIQNGCRNYRFIPILFPGAKKSYVPTWLQNTYIYSWPKDRDDILRRLMRVEKYRPPPIGPLPTIVSIPLS